MAICMMCFNQLESKVDEKGIWHYRCSYCVEHQDKTSLIKCPICECTAHEEICLTVSFSDELKLKRWVDSVNRPTIEKYRCLNCEHEWYTKEFEEYLFKKSVC